jgi:hypothetical protein
MKWVTSNAGGHDATRSGVANPTNLESMDVALHNISPSSVVKRFDNFSTE